MEELYQRQYLLTVGRNKVINISIPPTIIRAGGAESIPSESGKGSVGEDGVYRDVLVRPAQAIDISELRITANIEYTKEGRSNKQGATLEIYNLSELNRSRIQVEDSVLLYAGYQSIQPEPPLLFAGQILSVQTEKRGADIITKIVCSEAGVSRKNIRISRVPVRGETSKDIAEWFAGIAAKNGIPKGNVFVPVEIPYPSGLPMSGNLFTLLEEFCSNTNLQFYITLGRLYIEPIDITPVKTLLTLTEENIKGTIEKEEDNSGKTSTDPSSVSGIKLTTFLNANIQLSTIVDVAFGDYKGRYEVASIRHNLDLEGKNWDTIVSCKKRTGKESTSGIVGIF